MGARPPSPRFARERSAYIPFTLPKIVPREQREPRGLGDLPPIEQKGTLDTLVYDIHQRTGSITEISELGTFQTCLIRHTASYRPMLAYFHGNTSPFRLSAFPGQEQDGAQCSVVIQAQSVPSSFRFRPLIPKNQMSECTLVFRPPPSWKRPPNECLCEQVEPHPLPPRICMYVYRGSFQTLYQHRVNERSDSSAWKGSLHVCLVCRCGVLSLALSLR